jgi:hypothetical protein
MPIALSLGLSDVYILLKSRTHVSLSGRLPPFKASGKSMRSDDNETHYHDIRKIHAKGTGYKIAKGKSVKLLKS